MRVFVVWFLLSSTLAWVPSAQEAEEDPSARVSAWVEQELARGIRLAFDERYRESAAIFKSVLARRPEEVRALYFAGLCHWRLKEPDKAVTYLRAALETEPAFPEPYFWLAQIHHRRGRPAQARDVVKAGLRSFPRNKALRELQATWGDE